MTPGMAALDALGRVSIILVPNSVHRLDAGFYKKRYPDARVVAPAAARAKVEDVIAVDALAEDELPKHGVTIHPLPGWKHGELGYEFALPGGGRALVLSDVLTNANPVPGFGGWVSSNITTAVKGRRIWTSRASSELRAMLTDRAAGARTRLARLARLRRTAALVVPQVRDARSSRACEVTLRPLSLDDVAALRAAASESRRTMASASFLTVASRCVRTSTVPRAARPGDRLPFAIVWRGRVVGSTSFIEPRIWQWPVGCELQRIDRPDTVEIGSTGSRLQRSGRAATPRRSS